MNSQKRVAEIWSGAMGRIPRSGFSLPDISDLEWHPLGKAGDDNWIIAPANFDWRAKGRIEVREGDSGNVFVISQHSAWTGTGIFWGNGHTIIVSKHVRADLHCYISGNDTLTFIGSHTTIINATIYNQGEGTHILIGDECLFAHGIAIRSYDDHAIFDVDTGSHLNIAADISIGPYVWICPEVHILKGTRIGFGSIVGERSLVTSDIGRCVLAVGVPARAVRERVSWDNDPMPRTETRQKVRDKFDAFN